MGEFKNGETVYWDHKSAYYIGKDPYDSTWSYVVNIHSGEVGTIQTAALSSEPPMTLRELNGKSLYDLVQTTWVEVNNNYSSSLWSSPAATPEVKELYMRLAEKLNYTAED